MFRPSQSLLFRPMPVLNKLRIHQPLPLSPRQSKQLLNLLTSSFRQQLDMEHPQFRTDITPAPTRRRRLSVSDHEKHTTDRHMHSLLTNPLFSSRNSGSQVSLSREPMDIFDQAVSKGMMTTNYAKACLQAKKRQIVRSSVLKVRDGMRDSGAGLKVLKWLISSGTTKNLEFLDDEAFTQILMEYMVAENLQEAAWGWIKTSLERLPALALLSGLEFTQAQRKIVGPLLMLVRAEASDKSCSLDAAYISLSRAAGYLQGVPTTEMIHLLSVPEWFLFKTTIKFSSVRPAPSEAGFESFLSLVPVSTMHPERQFAYLSLLHPTKPSPELALRYFPTIRMNRTRDVTKKSNAQLENDRLNIQLGLETAKFLLEHHRQSEADYVINFLRTNYPRQLGIGDMRQLEQAKAEATSLELLEGLGLA
ncbi:hypothetical protein LZ554_005013 [Drepanopeziza brunnea f. sp. 'monogermtubi']|nr:hypothetical protein LZ554_005013 [Drepanopeziza brunnea f. sp. 'monogermtubi']